MMLRSCCHEREIMEALKDGHWPDGCDRELRAHVDRCPSCSDLVLVTQTFLQARRESWYAAPSASAGLIWWRAQLRRRNAAAQQVSKPITLAQTLAWFIIVPLAIVFAASQYRDGLHWASWWAELAPERTFHLWSLVLAKFDWSFVLQISSLGVLVLLSGVVLYLVSEKS